MDEKDPFDMSAIGLDDIMQLTEDADNNAQAKWLPGSYAPEYLNGRCEGSRSRSRRQWADDMI
jgi:hypothetical protein